MAARARGLPGRPVRRGFASLLLVAVVLGAPDLSAQPAGPVAPRTPRDAVSSYLSAAEQGDYERARQFLDLWRIPADRRDAVGADLARKLKIVLDRALLTDPESLSDDPAGERGDGLPPDAERAGVITSRRGKVDVLLHRVEAPGGPVWTFSASTVAQIPALYAEFGYGPLERLLPRVLLDVRVLDLALWQWIGLLLLVVIAYAISWLAARGALHVARALALRTQTTIDDTLVTAMAGPLRLGFALLVFAGGLFALALSLPAMQLFVALEKAGTIVVVAWSLLRVVDVFARVGAAQLAARGRAAAVAMVPLGGKAAKAVVLAFALIAILQNVGINPRSG